jgi:hypothetical protein
MADWKELAKARGLSIPDDQLDRIAPILEALEKSFTAVKVHLPDDLGMAVDFQVLDGKVDPR